MLLNERTKFKELINLLAVRLNCPVLSDNVLDGYINVFNENNFNIEHLKNSCKFLQATWKLQSFPKPSHFLESKDEKINTFKSENNTSKEPQWRIDCANKLGIHISKLPQHADYLTNEQRKILDIPTPEERKEIIKQVKFKLDILKNK